MFVYSAVSLLDFFRDLHFVFCPYATWGVLFFHVQSKYSVSSSFIIKSNSNQLPAYLVINWNRNQ
jgi:hypothetical protein